MIKRCTLHQHGKEGKEGLYKDGWSDLTSTKQKKTLATEGLLPGPVDASSDANPDLRVVLKTNLFTLIDPLTVSC